MTKGNTPRKLPEQGGPKGFDGSSEQFRRFLETARELGCEENFDQFEKALPGILRSPPRPATGAVKAGKKGGSAD